jgi:hypothetical protein
MKPIHIPQSESTGIFERVANRILGKKKQEAQAAAVAVATTPTGCSPAAYPPPSHQAAPTTAAQYPRDGIKQKSAPVNPSAAKFSSETLEMIAVAIGRIKVPSGDRAVAVATLNAKGIQLNEGGTKAIVYRDTFDAMPHGLRNEMIASGFTVLHERRPKNANPTEFAEATELRFPEPPPGLRRTWRQFWNASDEEAAKINEKAAKPESGLVLRQEIFDAYCSMWRQSWRYKDDPPPAVDHESLKPEEHIDIRERFHKKYMLALTTCTNIGPNEETPNDPPPPVRSDAMNAMAFMSLPDSVILDFGNTMSRERFAGRNMRAELKRAYRDGSPAIKGALYARYKAALVAFPNEYI